MKEPKHLTSLELRLMQFIWNAEEISVGSLQTLLSKDGHPLALPSIRTMLGILQSKGFVDRRLSGKAYLYKAIVPAESYQVSFMKNLLARTFNGSATGLVSTLLNNEVLSKQELDDVKKLIQDYDGDETE